MNRQQRFYSAMQKGLQDLGVSGNDILRTSYPQKLETKLGTLLLIDVKKEENSRTAKCYNCFTAFNDVVQAKEHIDCNPFSGKWNFHIPVKLLEPEDAAENILRILRDVVYKA